MSPKVQFAVAHISRSTPAYDDTTLRSFRRDRREGTQDATGLRRVPEDRRHLGAPPPLPGMWTRRLLRRLAQQARDKTFPRDETSDQPLVRAGRGLGLLLRRRHDVRADANVWSRDDRASLMPADVRRCAT